jgi:phosphoribosylformimino-5-aminoimidazole carboxamide ribotide isomerase
MLIIPAIDLQDGCVVRLVQGRSDQKIYSRDPVKTAKHWVKQGAELIHVVDLDGAMKGEPKNLPAVLEIVKNTKVPVQFGGGVRKLETIKILLDAGVSRVILGTKAVEDEAFLKKAFGAFKDSLIVSIDVQAKNILIKGWQASAKTRNLSGFLCSLQNLGFKEFIYTDTLKDGTLKGPNIKDIKALLKETGMKIIASGGVSSLDDIRRLKMLEKYGLVGIIVGKALYEGKFTLTQANIIG